MQCNSRGSPRARDPEPPPSRVKKNETEDAELQYPATQHEGQPQDDSVMHERMSQAANWTRGLSKDDGEAEEEEKVIKQNTSPFISSPAQSTSSWSPPISKTSSNTCSLMKIPICMARGGLNNVNIVNVLQHEKIEAPVTIVTLQELDLHSIQHNLNLRIDICHDPELFFQPISGQKGDKKRDEAKAYWLALAAEFRIYLHNAQPGCTECERVGTGSNPSFEPRLPGLFDNLREVVHMLVPESDHIEVADHLDTGLLMQQVQKGVLDAVGLSTWLANLLTSHCAPMRDCTALEVVKQVRTGTETANMDIFVDGLEKLFGLLEAMKLDIANHQIRSFRYLLIEGTVEFQRDCFSNAIEARQIDITTSQSWYRKHMVKHRFGCGFEEKGEDAQKFACLIHGLVSLCRPSQREVPSTFQYDHNRIMRLQEDLQDHIQMNLCLAVFNQRVQELTGPRCDPSTMHEDLKQRIICLTEDEEGNGGAISDHLEAIGIEITRAAFSMQPQHTKAMFTLSSFDFNRTIRLLQDVFNHEEQHASVTNSYLSSLEERTWQFATQFEKLSTREISNAQKHWAQAQAGKDIVLAEWDELARKLAHIGVIHWRVWRDICYDDEASDNDAGAHLDSSNVIEYYERDSMDGSARTPTSVLLISTDQSRDTGSTAALEKQPSSMQVLDTVIQRHDSGFAEFAESIECISIYEPKQDLDQNWKCHKTRRKPEETDREGNG